MTEFTLPRMSGMVTGMHNNENVVFAWSIKRDLTTGIYVAVYTIVCETIAYVVKHDVAAVVGINVAAVGTTALDATIAIGEYEPLNFPGKFNDVTIELKAFMVARAYALVQ